MFTVLSFYFYGILISVEYIRAQDVTLCRRSLELMVRHRCVRVCVRAHVRVSLCHLVNQEWQKTNGQNSAKEKETEREKDSYITPRLKSREKHLIYNVILHIRKVSAVERWCDKRLFFSHPQCFSHLTLRYWHQLNTGRENPVWARKHWFMEPAFWQRAAKHLSTTARRRVMSNEPGVHHIHSVWDCGLGHFFQESKQYTCTVNNVTWHFFV